MQGIIIHLSALLVVIIFQPGIEAGLSVFVSRFSCSF
jgi:hypothetical protein